ncbi:hypothetical protein Pla163_05470 [Planctomycetes bacterium Pla163]|uniref:Uncharacterized protein n=1 Tax=Rohdeia mirabilis TaxID=2528008 RepID=A0A518CW75_9BACT|nr:hypothetical protein Pla163_05470 [Planctomycetes bacterium Pla163]
MLNGTTLLAFKILGATTLVGGALVVGDIARKAAEGETRGRAFEVVTTLEVTDMTMVVDGEEMDTERMLGRGASTTTTRLEVSDEFEKADGTRPTLLRRTYDAIARTTERPESGGGGGGGFGGRGDGERPQLESGLVGEDVLFDWDAETEAYTARIPEDSTLDEALLEGLVADLDLADLLPSAAVEVEESWDVPLHVLESILRPGGNLHLAMPEREGADERRGGGRRGFGGGSTDPTALGVEPEYRGEFKATLAEITGDEGERVARITFVVDASSKYDMTDAIEDVTRETQRGDMTIVTLEAVTTNSFDGKGELLWNLARGCAVSFTLEADIEREEINATETIFDEGGRTMERASTSEGTLAYSYVLRGEDE